MAGVLTAASRALRSRSSVGFAARLQPLLDRVSPAATGYEQGATAQPLQSPSCLASGDGANQPYSTAITAAGASIASHHGVPASIRSTRARWAASVPQPPAQSGAPAATVASPSGSSSTSEQHQQLWPAPTIAQTAQLQEHAPEALLYRVDVVTGDIRGAGTSAPATLQLVGSAGSSDSYLLGEDDVSTGFQRGTTRTFLLAVDRHIGDLQRLQVEQQAGSFSDLGIGWFLDRIDVTLPCGELLSFPCGHWIGKSDAGDVVGPRQRNLIPCCLVKSKEQAPTGKPICVAASALSVPHPDKVKDGVKAVNRKGGGWGGDDAYFLTDGGRMGLYGLGVADGVYMWRSQGIDSGAYSRQLMDEARRLVQDEGYIDVLTVLQQAEGRVKREGTKGSSTVCIVLIDAPQGRLTSANLGDSGFLVLGTTSQQRLLHVKYRSPQQEHEFGFPYQLGHQEAADSAEDAILMTLPVIPGDIIVLGSDGLFDNVTDQEMIDIAEQLLREGNCSPGEVARSLLHTAYYNSIDKRKSTPYSMAATEVFDMVYSGGKKDDITVVVAEVKPPNPDGTTTHRLNRRR